METQTTFHVTSSMMRYGERIPMRMVYDAGDE